MQSPSLAKVGPFRVIALNFIALLASAVAPISGAVAGTDPAAVKISGMADVIAEGGQRDWAPPEQKLVLREAELSFYSAVDQLFDATLTMAAHRENGEQKFEAHEGYLSSSRLIPRSRLRMGLFFLGFGRLNQFHRHDWPFISAPRVHQEFFGDEGVHDAGVEYAYLFPFDDFFLELTAGITSGWRFDNEQATELRPAVPTHYVRLAHFFSVPWGGSSQLGANYVGRNTGDGQAQRFFGLDWTSKWRDANMLQYLLQSEIWVRSRSAQGSTTGAESETAWGAYFNPEYWFIGPGGGAWGVATRWDLYNTSGTSTQAQTFTTALVPQLSWKPSEFTTIRANYELDFQSTATQSLKYYSQSFQIQAMVILGAHPAHDF